MRSSRVEGWRAGMADREKVVTALECLADGQTCACCDYKPYDDCSRRVARDAIALLKELADKAITDDASIPEQFWPSMRYDPSDDVVACTSCLICGKDIPLRRYESGPMVCSECKEVIALLKQQEAKTGKWIPIESPTGVKAFGVNEMTVMDVRCSVCGSEEDVSFTGYKYCPRCGAKMKGR